MKKACNVDGVLTFLFPNQMVKKKKMMGFFVKNKYPYYFI